MKTVFVAMSADIFHTGHLNIIKVARELGDVVVGLGTDEVNAKHKQMAFMSYEQRKAILENIKGVVEVIPQPSLDLVPNLRALKPDYVVHGDDWKTGFLRETRQRVINVLQEWEGQLIEPSYTQGISSTNLRATIQEAQKSTESRSRQLQRLLQFKPFVRFIAVHDGLSAAVGHNAQLPNGKRQHEFDALWLSAKAEALAKGISDPTLLDFSARLQTVQAILHSTHKPLIVELPDCLSPEQTAYQAAQLERVGVSGAVVTLPNTAASWTIHLQQTQEAITSHHFVLIANMGQLTAHMPLEALLQAAQEAAQAGANALLLDTTQHALNRLTQFMRQYKTTKERLPMILQPRDFLGGPTTLSDVQAIVVANQLLQAAFNAMTDTAVSLLKQAQEDTFTSVSDPNVLLGLL